MTRLQPNDLNSQDMARALDFLHGLIFEMLFKTDGRTTDLLETLLNEKLLVTVLRQEQIHEEPAGLLGESSGAPYYLRESILITEKSQFIVSHNVALVYSKHVPAAMFEKIAHKQEGIGKVMSSIGLRTFRKVGDFGLVAAEEAVDLFRQPIRLRFPEPHEQVPCKMYSIYFGSMPGIQMLEYYHPDLVRHRLLQMLQSNV